MIKHPIPLAVNHGNGVQVHRSMPGMVEVTYIGLEAENLVGVIVTTQREITPGLSLNAPLDAHTFRRP